MKFRHQILLCALVAGSALWAQIPTGLTLAPGPYTVTDLGPQVFAARLYKSFVFTSRGEAHFVALFGRKAVKQDPIQLFHVNLTKKSAARVVNGSLGTPSSQAYVLHSNGKFYWCSGAAGYLNSFDPATGESRVIRALADAGAQWMEQGDDGRLYIGEVWKGTLESYDPATEEWINYGVIDDPGPPYYRSAYYVAADQRAIYVVIGSNPWYLVVIDKATRRQTVYWKGDSLTGVNLDRGVSGGWYVFRGTKTGFQYFSAQNGVVTPMAYSSVPPRVPFHLHGNVLNDPSLSASLFGFELKLDGLNADSTTGGKASLDYRPVGPTRFLTTEATVGMDPLPLSRLFPYDRDRFIGFSDAYAPAFLFDTTTRTSTILGRTGFSDYDAVTDGMAWYFGGYPASTVKYDPCRAWTMATSTVNREATTLNPFKLSGGFGKYHYFLARGNDNRVYVAANHERESTGGELGWWDPAFGDRGSLRDPFRNLAPRGLAAVNGGAQLVYSGATLDKTEAQLAVFDVASKKVIARWTPVPGSDNTGSVVAVSPTDVVGVLQFYSDVLVYRINVTTGKVIYTRRLKGKAFSWLPPADRRLTLGPDGFVWFYVDAFVSRLNPSDGAVQRVLHGAPEGFLAFMDRDLYIVSRGSTSIRRVVGLLVSR